jgi:hypothetical protein
MSDTRIQGVAFFRGPNNVMLDDEDIPVVK